MYGVISIFFVVRKVLIVGLVTGQLGHPVSGHGLLAAARLVLPLPLALLRSLLELADLGLPRLLCLPPASTTSVGQAAGGRRRRAGRRARRQSGRRRGR